MDAASTALLAFAATAGLLTITPGLDTALVLRTAAAQGPARAWMAGLGVCFGCLLWAAVVAVGLGALLSASRAAYTILQWLGAAYLLWLGVGMLRRPRTALAPAVAPKRPPGSPFARGALTNLLNPKVGLFYVSLLPRFVPHGAPVAAFILLLGAVHALLGLVWFSALIAATRPISRLLQRPDVLRTLDRATGGVFVLFGLGLALDAPRP